MNVGIFTRYQPRDVTYAALQVADLARRCGNQASVYTTTPRRPPVHARWDDRVVRDAKFTEWAGNLDLIVWTECPAPEQVAWAMRSRKGLPDRRTILISSWDDTTHQVRKVYPAFTAVVAPSEAAAGFLRDDMGAKNVVAAPWSPPLPVTVRPPPEEGRRPCLHFPLCDARSREHDPSTVDIVERLLRRGVDADIRVTVGGRSGEVVRRLERRARQHANLAIARCGDFEGFAMHLAEHDLTVLTSTAESFGMTALCSLHAGAPVVAFDSPPLDEFVVHGRNGILVRSTVTGKVPGTAANDEKDQAKFEAALAWALDGDGRLAAMRAACSGGLEARARAFEQTWGTLLSEA